MLALNPRIHIQEHYTPAQALLLLLSLLELIISAGAGAAARLSCILFGRLDGYPCNALQPVHLGTRSFPRTQCARSHPQDGGLPTWICLTACRAVVLMPPRIPQMRALSARASRGCPALPW